MKIVLTGRIVTDFGVIDVQEAGFDFDKTLRGLGTSEDVGLSCDFEVEAWELEDNELTVRGEKESLPEPDEIKDANCKVEIMMAGAERVTFLKIHDPEVETV